MTDQMTTENPQHNTYAHGGLPFMENIDLLLHKPVCPSNMALLCCELLEQHNKPSTKLSENILPTDSTGSKKVLLVEDIEANQIVAEEMLKSFGIQPTIANNGKLGLEAQLNSPFDLILMDCHMPVMDGFEATEKIREYESLKGLKRTPIIALTANNQPDQRSLCKKAGMDDVLFKPYSMEQMRYLLKSRLNIQIDDHESAYNTEKETILTFNSSSSHSDQDSSGKLAFDEKVFNRLLKTLKHDRMSILVATFLRECSSMLDNLPLALETKQNDESRRLVHSIKSSAANLGAMKLSQLAQESEEASQLEDFEFIRDNQDNLRNLFEEASRLIKHYLEKQAP